MLRWFCLSDFNYRIDENEKVAEIFYDIREGNQNNFLFIIYSYCTSCSDHFSGISNLKLSGNLEESFKKLINKLNSF